MFPNLKLRLWTTGIRQNRLAKILTIDETTLSRIVNGFRQPSPEMRGRIAAALDCDETWLFQTEERFRAGSAATPPEGFAAPAAAGRAAPHASTEDGPARGSVLSANDGGNGAAVRRVSRRNRAPMSL